MATTEAAVLDRITSVLVSQGFKAAAWPDFSRTPTVEEDQAFAVAFTGTQPIGQMNYYEEMQATVEIQWLRLVKNDFVTARRQALTDARSIVAGVVRDGTAGNYAVDDGGRVFDLEFPKNATYLRARVRVPVNFEAAL